MNDMSQLRNTMKTIEDLYIIIQLYKIRGRVTITQDHH